jgi:MoaA/NifB/PqqE/SkfB family radical SAM enzyme
MGYRVVSVSGGEPFLYRGLEEILAHAKSLGLHTTVTTNGFFTGKDRLGPLRELIDVLAISLDGPPEMHNQVRGSARAFERLEAGLVHIRKAEIPFGFIHSLTQRSWEHLLWIASYAAGAGARLLQIHPLELAGRAGSQMPNSAPDEAVLEKTYVLAFGLAAKYADTMRIQLDLLYRDHLREEPELVYAAASDGTPRDAIPAQLLGLLVAEPDGTVVPISYGFSRRYKLCNVKDKSLADAWPDYFATGYASFKALCHCVYEELCAPEAPLLSNWHEVMVSRSHDERAVRLPSA